MKRISCLITCLMLLAAFQACSDSNSKIVATVGEDKITADEFEERYTDYIVVSGVEDNLRTRKAILDNMINEILLKEYDDNKNVYNNPEYVKEEEWTYKQNLLAFLKDREVYTGISATDKEVRDAFVKMNQTLKARHLYAPTKEEADQLYELLQTGATFESLARQVFTDSTLKRNGGYIGSFTWGEMDPAFEDTAYSLEVGEYSKPVKTRTGYSIIKLEEREYNPLLTEYQYHQKKSEIAQTIKIRKKKPSESEFIESLYDENEFDLKEGGVMKVADLLQKDYRNMETDDDFENELAAVYKDKEFYVDDVLTRIENLPEYHRSNINSVKSLKAAIEGFVIQDILVEEAEEKGYDEDEIMLDSYETMLNNLFLKFKAREVAQKVDIPDSTLKNYYDENLLFFSTHDEINIQEIIVDNKSLAIELMQRLRAGEDFGDLAQQYSLRDWSAKNRGEIGFAPLSKFGILKSTFWDASVGNLIGPREIDGYYGLFKILGKKESKPIEFDLIKDEVAKVFREERQNVLLSDYLTHLKNTVDVSVNEDLLGSLSFSLLN